MHLSALSLALNRPGAVGLTLKQAVAALFASGEQGAWYDPSDRSTLFQDSAGTLPVTEVEQPVGLMLDRRKGLALGSELITNAADREFSSDTGYWSLGAQGSISGGTFNVTAGSGTQISKTIAGMGLTQGKWYKVTYTITSLTSGSFRWQFSSAVTTRTAAGTYTEYWLPDGTTLQGFCGTNTTLSLDNISVKLLDGNHAYQTGSAARPVLRARYNLLTYSEQISSATWSLSALQAITPNTAVAPDGTTTAEAIISTTAATQHHVSTPSAVTGVGTYTLSIYAKANGYNYVQLLWGSGNDYANFLLTGAGSVSQNSGGSPAIVSVGNGWYRCSITSTLSVASAVYFMPMITGTESRFASTTGDGTSGIYIWGAQLNLGSTAMSYQRIAATPTLSQPPTYATTSTMGGEVFRPYLLFDGGDDTMFTSALDLSASDKLTLCVGITKRQDANAGTVCETSANYNSNTGCFTFYAPASSTLRYYAGINGGASNAGGVTVEYAGESTNVVTSLLDIGQAAYTDEIKMRVDGAQKALTYSNTNTGTGNFANNQPMYIGRRPGTTAYFNGYIYGIVLRGGVTPLSSVQAVETYLAGKTGVTL